MRGIGINQTGSHFYSILAFMEQKQLTKLCGPNTKFDDMNEPTLLAGNVLLISTPLDVFFCPTRRSPAVSAPNSISFIIQPILCGVLQAEASNDYAANGGEVRVPFPGYPPTLSQAPGWDWTDSYRQSTGVVYIHHQFKLREITDGTSKTMLLGEKGCNPDSYHNGNDWGVDQGPYPGDERDPIRWCSWDTTSANYMAPMRDRQGTDPSWQWGSSHAAIFNIACCDGSVHPISYDISEINMRRLCNRCDGKQFVDPNPY